MSSRRKGKPVRRVETGESGGEEPRAGSPASHDHYSALNSADPSREASPFLGGGAAEDEETATACGELAVYEADKNIVDFSQSLNQPPPQPSRPSSGVYMIEPGEVDRPVVAGHHHHHRPLPNGMDHDFESGDAQHLGRQQQQVAHMSSLAHQQVQASKSNDDDDNDMDCVQVELDARNDRINEFSSHNNDAEFGSERQSSTGAGDEGVVGSAVNSDPKYRQMVVEKFTRFQKLMQLMRIKPHAEALKESGVTAEEFVHFQGMMVKTQAAAFAAANNHRTNPITEPNQQMPAVQRGLQNWPVASSFAGRGVVGLAAAECASGGDYEEGSEQTQDKQHEQKKAEYSNETSTDLAGPSSVAVSPTAPGATGAVSFASGTPTMAGNHHLPMNNMAASIMLALSKMSGTNSVGAGGDVMPTSYNKLELSHLINRNINLSGQRLASFSSRQMQQVSHHHHQQQQQQQAAQQQQQQQSQDYSGDPETEVDSITAGTVSSGVGSIKRGTLPPTSFHQEVYDKYITKFTANNPCSQQMCPHRNREHYHCIDNDCNYQRFTNKSDVKRHYNMHKKRDNSLLHGFMRFAPSDECRAHFKGPCMYNGKSTHYHCLHSGCTKVYTSTSDVMTHKKFHIKDEELAKNGFQRYRANERCDWSDCQFNDMRTTHFHCTREGCRFRFKNKCEMEKHKSYHIKDDNYTRQGFKKFYKNETCPFPTCQWNQKTNHFHCLRDNCAESFSSTNQAISHKRKHEREDSGVMMTSSATLAPSSTTPPPTMLPHIHHPHLNNSDGANHSAFQSTRFVADSSPVNSSSSAAAPSPRQLISREMEAVRAAASSDMHKPGGSIPMNLVNGGSGSKNGGNLSVVGGGMLNNSGGGSSLLNAAPDLTQRVLMSNSMRGDEHAKKDPTPSSAFRDGGDQLNRFTYHHHNRHNSLEAVPHKLTGAKNGDADSTLLDVIASASNGIEKRASNDPINLTMQREDETEQPQRSAKKLDETNTENGAAAAVSFGSSSSYVLAVSQKIDKYFRGYEARECRLSLNSGTSCEWYQTRHFHCVIEGCCAVFTDRNLVFNHTNYHYQLERKGIEETISAVFKTRPSSNIMGRPPMASTPLTTGHNQQSSSKNSGSEQRTPISLPQKRSMSSDLTCVGDDHQGSASASKPPKYDVAMKDLTSTPVPSVAAANNNNNKMQQLASQMNSGSLMNGVLMRSRLSNGGGDESGMSLLNRTDPNISSSINSSFDTSAHDISATANTTNSNNGRESLTEALENETRKCFDAFASSKPRLATPHHHHVKMHAARLDSNQQQLAAPATLSGESRGVMGMKSDATLHRPHHVVVDGDDQLVNRSSPQHQLSESKEESNKIEQVEAQLAAYKKHLSASMTGATSSSGAGYPMKPEVLRFMQSEGYKRLLGSAQLQQLQQNQTQNMNLQRGLELQQIYQQYQQMAAQSQRQQQQHHELEKKRQIQQNNAANQPQMTANQVAGNESTNSPAPMTASGAMNGGDAPVDLSKNTCAAAGPSPGGDEQKEVNGRRWSTGGSYTGGESKVSGATGSSDDDTTSLPAALSLRMSNGVVGEVDMTATTSSSQVSCVTTTLPPPLASAAGGASKPAGRTEITSDGHMFTSYKLNTKLPEGFVRFEASEDCQDYKCSFRNRAPHFHCTKPRCGYRFVGRSHINKHQMHHQRVASLERNDFKRFKMNQDCYYETCQFRLKNTHFHCLRCSFVCSDSAKVSTHRKAHERSDELEQYNFKRFKGIDDCGRNNCKYRYKNMSHYHCKSCDYTVVGMSTIEQHYNKHKHNNALAQVCTKTNQEIEKLNSSHHHHQHDATTTTTTTSPMMRQQQQTSATPADVLRLAHKRLTAASAAASAGANSSGGGGLPTFNLAHFAPILCNLKREPNNPTASQALALEGGASGGSSSSSSASTVFQPHHFSSAAAAAMLSQQQQHFASMLSSNSAVGGGTMATSGEAMERQMVEPASSSSPFRLMPQQASRRLSGADIPMHIGADADH